MASQARGSFIRDLNSVLRLPEDQDIRMLLQSNLPPTNSTQRGTLTGMIVEREAVIRKLDSVARDSQGLRDLCRHASLSLSTQVQRFKSVLSPVREIPVEILAHIFEIVICDMMHRLQRQVLSLSQVCSRWRNICHNTPRLWMIYGRTVSGNRCGTLRDNVQQALDVELTSAWFHRAVPYPVRVVLDAYEYPSTIPLERILPHANNIAELSLSVSVTYFPSVPDHLLAALSFPVLRRVRVAVYAYLVPLPQGYIDPIFPFLERLRAPQLTDVDLQLQDTMPNLQGYAHQLRRLSISLRSYRHSDIRVPKTGNVLQTLQHCTQLEYLKLTLNCREIQRISGSIRLEGLNTLCLDLRDYSLNTEYMHIISVLTLPELEDFKVLFPTADHEWNWPGWMSFKHRSCSRLRRISIRWADKAPPDRLSAFLLGMDTVEKIHIGNYTYGLAFLRHFLTFDPSRPFLPNLHRLTVVTRVDKKDRTSELDELIEKIVRSRWWSDSTTRSYRRWTRVHIARDDFAGSLFDDLEDGDDGQLLSPPASERMEEIAAEGVSLDFDTRNYY